MTRGDVTIRTDKHGHELADYPNESDHGRLLGFLVSGNAAYATEERVVLATLDARGTLRTPPRERWLSGEFPLAAVGLTPADYVLYAADEAGPWRALTSLAREAVRAKGIDPAKVHRDGVETGDPETLVSRLDEDPGTAAEASGALRQFTLDHPARVEPHAETLLDVLDALVTVSTDGQADEADFERLVVARDVAFVLARLARARPGVLSPHLDRLLATLGAAPDDGDDHPHVSYLLDVLDVLGRADPDGAARVLCERLDSTPETATRTLEALYRLEHRYARDEHPLLEDESLRTAVEAALDAEDLAVRQAATEVDTVHGFHRGS